MQKNPKSHFKWGLFETTILEELLLSLNNRFEILGLKLSSIPFEKCWRESLSLWSMIPLFEEQHLKKLFSCCVNMERVRYIFGFLPRLSLALAFTALTLLQNQS